MVFTWLTGCCVIPALVGYTEDGDGSGEPDDGMEDDQYLKTHNIHKKTVYIASTSNSHKLVCKT